MIDYPYQQGTSYLSKAYPHETLKLGVDGWSIEKFIIGAHEWEPSVQERLMLVRDASLDPKHNDQEPVGEPVVVGALQEGDSDVVREGLYPNIGLTNVMDCACLFFWIRILKKYDHH